MTALRAEIVLHYGGESKRIVLLHDDGTDSLCRERREGARRPLVRTASYVAATYGDNRTMGEAVACAGLGDGARVSARREGG